MLGGSPPLHGRTPPAFLGAQLTQHPPLRYSRRYDVPVALSGLVMKGLEKDPGDGPRSGGELLSTLDSPDAIGGPVASPRRVVASRRLSRWKTGVATAAPLIVVGALFAFAMWP